MLILEEIERLKKMYESETKIKGVPQYLIPKRSQRTVEALEELIAWRDASGNKPPLALKFDKEGRLETVIPEGKSVATLQNLDPKKGGNGIISIIFDPPFLLERNYVAQVKKSVQSFLVELEKIPDLLLRTPIKITVSLGEGYILNLETLTDKGKVMEKFYRTSEIKEDPEIKIATKVSIDFPERHWIPGNPYPATYDNVVAHFLGVVVRKENGEYESKLEYGLDVGRAPKNPESQNIGDAVEKIVPFLNRTAEEFREQTARLNSVLPRSS